MRAAHHALLVACVGALVTSSVEVASARVHHRVYVTRPLRHHFVFANPGDANIVSDIGAFGGFFETGIPGATTANPYERPAYGYDGHGYYGPGAAYPDF